MLYHINELKDKGSLDYSKIGLCKQIITRLRMIPHSYIFGVMRAFLKFGYIRNDNDFTIQDAGGKGEGYYTNKEIKKGEICYLFDGPVQFCHFANNDWTLCPNWYGVSHDLWIDVQHPFVKTNHSCEPNASVYKSRILIALRDIKKGEEISFDYAMTEDEKLWQMGCLCGGASCRKTVRAIQHTDMNDVLKSYPYINSAFKKIADEKLKTTAGNSALRIILRVSMALIIIISIFIVYRTMVINHDFEITQNQDGPISDQY